MFLRGFQPLMLRIEPFSVGPAAVDDRHEPKAYRRPQGLPVLSLCLQPIEESSCRGTPPTADCSSHARMQNSADVSVSFLADPFLRDSITALLDLRIRAGAGHQLFDGVESGDVSDFNVKHRSAPFADPVDAPQDRRGLWVFDSVPEPTSGPIDAFFEPKKILCDHRQSQSSVRICLPSDAASGIVDNLSGPLLGDVWDLGYCLYSGLNDLVGRRMPFD